MEKIKAINLEKINIKIKLVLFVLFLGISIFVPFLKQQFITGPFINAVLFVATAVLGIGAGILIGFLPSLVSAFSGLLPLPLLPMIPYIIISNVILVLIFGALRKKSFLKAVLTASFVKFLFLYLSSYFIVNFFIGRGLSSQIITMMSWPQLITALIGGIMAYFILKNNKTKKI